MKKNILLWIFLILLSSCFWEDSKNSFSSSSKNPFINEHIDIWANKEKLKTLNQDFQRDLDEFIWNTSTRKITENSSWIVNKVATGVIKTETEKSILISSGANN